jgi:hypothetical protein
VTPLPNLVPCAVRLLSEHPHRLAWLKGRWRWLLADESRWPTTQYVVNEPLKEEQKMVGIATATLSGNLTRDPGSATLASGTEVARLRVGTTTRRRLGEEWVDKTNYFTVEADGPQAQSCAQFLRKGSRVLVDAELDWRSGQIGRSAHERP